MGRATSVVRLAAPVDPGRAREDVRAILRGAAYRAKQPPRPLDGLLSWLDDRMRPVGRVLRPVGRFLGRVFGPAGRVIARVWDATIGRLPTPLAILVVAAGIAAAIVAVARAVERRAAPATRESVTGAALRGDAPTPEALERDADAAERAGDLDTAVRLRFRAGLLRLERDARAITNRPGLTTREVRVRLASDRFEHVADTFEAVAYGGRDADGDDTTDAREQWPRIVAEARRG